MSTPRSFEALRRANPRHEAGFAEAVDLAAVGLRARIEAAVNANRPESGRRRSHHRLISLSAAGLALAAAAGAAVFLTVGSSGPGVENAAAAVEKAATLTASSAEESGSVTVRITHDGQLWAEKSVQWNGNDVEITDGSPGGHSSGLPLIVVDGTLYDHDPGQPGWVEVGPVTGIDPDSGTTPTEILAAVREDLDGATLRRITGAIAAGGLTTTDQPDGSTVYSGEVAAGQIARESGFKEGQAIRVFPFGYVAHDAAADPASLLDTAVTVGSDSVIRELAVTWGTWTYSVTYSDLGSTPAPVAPANARSLRDERLRMRTTTTP